MHQKWGNNVLKVCPNLSRSLNLLKKHQKWGNNVLKVCPSISHWSLNLLMNNSPHDPRRSTSRWTRGERRQTEELKIKKKMNSTFYKIQNMGGGCGSVGRAVASDTREVHSLNPAIGKIYTEYCLLSTVLN